MPLLAALMWQHQAQFRWYQHGDGDGTSSIRLENCMKEQFEFPLMEILKKSK